MLTQLDVINQCLASMALAPITEGEIPGNPYAESAAASLTQITLDTLSKGWWFNERLLTTDPLPSALLRVEGNFGRTLSWRGAASGIYDHTTGTLLAAPYPPKTLGYVSVPFPDLPPPLQAYIAALTLVAFQSAFDGSDTKYKQIAGEVARSLSVVQEIDRNSRVNYKRLWELLAYGWWFNTVEFTAPAGPSAYLPAMTLNVQGPPNKPLFLNANSGAVCETWTGAPIKTPVERCRAIVQVPPEALPPAAAEWLRKASALDAERESLNADPRMLAELNAQLDASWSTLRRENAERMVIREQSREFQARGWWFNTFAVEDSIVSAADALAYSHYASLSLHINFGGELGVLGHIGGAVPFSAGTAAVPQGDSPLVYANLTRSGGWGTTTVTLPSGTGAESLVEPLTVGGSAEVTGLADARVVAYLTCVPGDQLWVVEQDYVTDAFNGLYTASIVLVVGPDAANGDRYHIGAGSRTGGISIARITRLPGLGLRI